jgi:arogenate dehydrogenase (NADP+), plant
MILVRQPQRLYIWCTAVGLILSALSSSPAAFASLEIPTLLSSASSSRPTTMSHVAVLSSTTDLSHANHKRPKRDPSLQAVVPSNNNDNDDDATDNTTNYNNNNIADTNTDMSSAAGRLETLKQREAELSHLLAQVRREKLHTLRSRPLTMGIVGFGRFGQFIARTLARYGRVVVTSRSDYTAIAQGMGVTYVPLSDPMAFLEQGLDVIVLAVSITSFQSTVESLVPHVRADLQRRGPHARGPLIVDVLSVKEHARQVMLDLLPEECDILCTHPMFGPDSGKDGWTGLNFVYEKTRIDKVVLHPTQQPPVSPRRNTTTEQFVDGEGNVHSVHEDSEAHVEGMDRMERFLSIWEEEGCRMVPMSCHDHDAYAANSQFITHLMGRILGVQGLAQTPIDTSGFQSVLKLIDSTTADSFDLFYGLYKYNQNSMDTIEQLRSAMDDVVNRLKDTEAQEQAKDDQPMQAISKL